MPSHYTKKVSKKAGNVPIKKTAMKKKAKKLPYAARNDPSVKPYLTKGNDFMGHTAMRKQLKNKKSLARDVRVKSVKRPSARAGAGIHELLPTDQRDKVRGNNAAIAFQAGARIATDRAYLVDKSNKTGAHTGAMPKKKGRGSTNTTGQSEAHDRLREAKVSKKRKTKRGEVYERMANALDTMPTGQQMMESDRLTGGIPNRKKAKAFKAPKAKDDERIFEAQLQQRQREHMKRRFVTQATKDGHTGRMPSPPREDIQNDGSGGGYIPAGGVFPPSSPYRDMEGSDETEKMTNLSSFMTAPGRHGFEGDSMTVDKICGKCEYPFVQTAESNCLHCGKIV